MAIEVEIFDMKVPNEKTKRGEFNTQEIMCWKKYGIYDEALKKGITEKQYGELAFIWDTLLINLDHSSKAIQQEFGDLTYPNNRMVIWGENVYYLNLDNVKMWWNVKEGKVKVTLDYIAENAEELRKEHYHEIIVSEPENIEFHYGVPFKTVRERSITQTPTHFQRVSQTYTIDGDGFIK